MSIGVLCPTYKRGPASMQPVIDSFEKTRVSESTELIFAIELDDAVSHQPVSGQNTWIYELPQPSKGGLCDALNQVALFHVNKYDVLGCIGDDNRFETHAWDHLVRQAFKDPSVAFVYGPDGSNNIERELPTWWFTRTSVVKALGWMGNPACHHFFLDDAVRELGKETGSLRYLPDCFIRHLHFSFGLSPLDDTYKHTMRVGGGDDIRYRQWRYSPQFDENVKKVREALRG